MNSNKSPLSTILFGLAILLFTTATFAMFGAVVIKNDGGAISIPNMFQAAFGGNGYSRVTGLTTIFVFQMIILAGVFSIIFGIFTHKFNNIVVIVLYALICLCSFIALIISFNAKEMYLSLNSGGAAHNEYTLGPGPIAYSVLHIVALVLTVSGLVLSRAGGSRR